MRTYPPDYYVYAYLRKSNLSPYYIGKGKGHRAWARQHNVVVPEDKNRIVIIESGLSDIGALAIERRLIRWYGRKDLGNGILRNLSDGGDGCEGRVHTDQAKKLIGDANRKRIWTEESKEKLRAFNKNRPQSVESNLKRSQTLQGRVLSKEHREKISEGQKGRVQTAETRALISAKKRARDLARRSSRSPK